MKIVKYRIYVFILLWTFGLVACSDNDDEDSGVISVPVVTGSDETYTIPGTSVSFTMKFIEGGTFWMGSSDTSAEFVFSRPQHRVSLSGFWLGEVEVSQALWKAVMGSSPLDEKPKFELYGVGDNYPVYWISWNDICLDNDSLGYKCFLTRLNELIPLPNGRKFCLPSEAQWEFAARGGIKSNNYAFSGGNDIEKVGWYSDNSSAGLHESKTKLPNELGLYDLCGNLREFLCDYYYTYSMNDEINPIHDTQSLHYNYRLLRGGSWNDSELRCRSVYRPGSTDPYLGFFCVGLRLAIR